MTYAGQLRVADSELDMHLGVCGSELERWAWLATKQFESAVAALIVARDRRSGEQFVAHVCYMHACRHRLQVMGNGPEHLANWPRSHATFGQYHVTGTSSLDVAMKFATGLWAELETARLWAYPRCSIEDRELGDLAEWRTVFWNCLPSSRPELAEWPLWSVHQERDRVRAAITDEFRTAVSKAGEVPRPRVSAAADAGGESAEAPDGLTDEGLLCFTQQVMMAFFRHWEAVPGDDDLAKFNGKFTSFLARPQFEQEFDRVQKCLFRSVAIGQTLGVDTAALRRFVEAFRHYDIPAAERQKYDASADIQRIREVLRSHSAALPESQAERAMKLDAVLDLRLRQSQYQLNPSLPGELPEGASDKILGELRAAGIEHEGDPVEWLCSLWGHRELARIFQRLTDSPTAETGKLRQETVDEPQETYIDTGARERHRDAMEAIINGGLAGLLQAAVGTKAEELASAAMMKLFESAPGTYGRWGQRDWASHLKQSTATVSKTKAWREIKAWRKSNKEARRVS